MDRLAAGGLVTVADQFGGIPEADLEHGGTVGVRPIRGVCRFDVRIPLVG